MRTASFSKKILELRFSGIGEMVELANKIEGDIIRMEIGDVDYLPPPCVKSALIKALEEGQTHYPPFNGYGDLIEAIIRKLQKENKIPATSENIFITSGASMGLFASLSVILNAGDEVIITDPSWPHFASMVSLVGGVTKHVSLDPQNNFQINIDELESKITEKTKVILINTPHNPTGAIMNQKTCEEVVKIANKYNITIIVDEEYEKFIFDDNRHISVGSLYDNTITIQSFSKTYAMCGFRVGYVVANPTFLKELSKMSLYSTMYTSSIAQRAALAVMKDGNDFTNNMVREFEKRMNFLVESLNKIDGVRCTKSQGSVYVWPNISGLGMTSFETSKFLVERAKVVTVPGSVFGENGEGYIRMSLGQPIGRIKEAIERITEAIKNKI